MLINGAAIRFRTKARIELTSQARFLYGRQIMSPEEADSPARRIYLALQSVYIGPEEDRPAELARARELVEEYKAQAGPPLAREILDRALQAAANDECYQALKLVRRIVRYEDETLGRAPPSRGEA